MFPSLKSLWAEARVQKGELGLWVTYTLIVAALPIWWVGTESLFSQGRLPSWIDTFGSSGDLLLVTVALTADGTARVVQAMVKSVGGSAKVGEKRSLLKGRVAILSLCLLNILFATMFFCIRGRTVG